MNLQHVREKITFYLDDSGTSTGKFIDLVLLVFNLFACILFVIDSYYETTLMWVRIAEYAVVTVFLIEYLLRIFTAEKRWKYIFSFYGIIDVVSIIPTFITLHQFRFLRGFKVLRILRFLRYLETENFFFGKISRFQLQVYRTLFTVLTILFIASGFILLAEASAPDRQIATFGQAFYFWVSALSTVGFGDFVPVTATGRAVTAIMILCGAIFLPWQAGILVRMLIRGEGNKKQVTCAKCGLKGHDLDASHCKACGEVIFQEYDGEA